MKPIIIIKYHKKLFAALFLTSFCSMTSFRQLYPKSKTLKFNFTKLILKVEKKRAPYQNVSWLSLMRTTLANVDMIMLNILCLVCSLTYIQATLPFKFGDCCK